MTSFDAQFVDRIVREVMRRLAADTAPPPAADLGCGPGRRTGRSATQRRSCCRNDSSPWRSWTANWTVFDD